jgi:CheY-like chemotaxis protein
MTTTFAPPRPLNVLIVEDNPDGAWTLARVIDLFGHTARVAGDGLEGLRAAREFAPDVALVDIGLPRVDGWAFARELRRRLPDRPLLIATTAFDSERDRARSLRAGFDHHLVKPLDLGELADLLQRHAARLPAEG